jgi:ATP-dependent RNA helicase DeaD
MDVAMAAVKLAHEATGAAADEDEIPDATLPTRDRDDRRTPSGGAKPGRPTHEGKPAGGGGGGGGGKATSPGMTRLYVGAGRAAGIRPKDLVGAIAGETSVVGRQIGAIEISDRFSLVEVPEANADEVISALVRTTIKGKRPNVRRERY